MPATPSGRRFASQTGVAVKRLVIFPTEHGGEIVIEVEEPAGTGTVRGARPDDVAERASKSFEAALATIKPATSALLARVGDLADQPTEVEIEFGIKLNAKFGAVIASADAEAHFTVTLRWTRPAGRAVRGG